jgi:CRISPR-associated protein Cas6
MPQPCCPACLCLAGHEIVPGHLSRRELRETPVIYAKFVAMRPASDTPIDEVDFHAACQSEFERLGIRPKMICGKPQRLRTSDGLLSGFSLMLYELESEANLRLQYEGLGVGRSHGCGIFVPHKSGTALER